MRIMAAVCLNRISANCLNPFILLSEGQGGRGLGAHWVYSSVIQGLGGPITTSREVGNNIEFSINKATALTQCWNYRSVTSMSETWECTKGLVTHASKVSQALGSTDDWGIILSFLFSKPFICKLFYNYFWKRFESNTRLIFNIISFTLCCAAYSFEKRHKRVFHALNLSSQWFFWNPICLIKDIPNKVIFYN